MAFTASEETLLRQLIEAFQNGKRLSDLPDARGTNPYDLYVEVLDIDGESKKAALATLLPYLEEQCAYGIERDTTVSSPACTRVGNAALHKSLPIQSRMRGVLLNDDGEVVEYLNPSDWTGQQRDGSRGQVMVEIPLHYRRFITYSNKQRVMLSEFPLPGYLQVPKGYVSANEATVQRSTNKLASVVNNTADYRGGNNDSTLDGTEKSLLGVPASDISRTNFRIYARNRKPGSSEWNCMTYNMHKTIYWLYVVEYANLNIQLPYNAELTTDGYRQGGLGRGVTNIHGVKWNEFNSQNPFIPCGYTDSLGNGTGVVPFVMPAGYDTEPCTTYVPRYRGIQNPFGHISKWTDGINVCVSPTEDNGGDGLSKVLVCSDPEKFKDTGYNGYRHVGNVDRNDGFIKEVIFGEEGDIIPSICSGAGSSTFFCDYHKTYVFNNEVLTGLIFGGTANVGSETGLACSESRFDPSFKATFIGSRLCFLPE